MVRKYLTIQEVQSRAIGIIQQANPDKPESWAREQWTRCVGNIDVPATASVALEILQGEFNIPVRAVKEIVELWESSVVEIDANN